MNINLFSRMEIFPMTISVQRTYADIASELYYAHYRAVRFILLRCKTHADMFACGSKSLLSETFHAS